MWEGTCKIIPFTASEYSTVYNTIMGLARQVKGDGQVCGGSSTLGNGWTVSASVGFEWWQFDSQDYSMQVDLDSAEGICGLSIYLDWKGFHACGGYSSLSINYGLWYEFTCLESFCFRFAIISTFMLFVLGCARFKLCTVCNSTVTLSHTETTVDITC